MVGEEDIAPKSRSALVASSRTVMAAAPPIAGPATRPVDLSTVRGASGRPLMAPDVRSHDLALAQSYNELRSDYRLARDGLDPLGPSLFNDLPDVIVVSAAAKHHFQNYRDPTVDDAQKWRRILPEVLTQARSVKVVDLRQLHDESQGALASHTGRHPGIISQLLASRAGRFYMNDEYKFVRECVERGERVLLLAFCVSNRHRSVASANAGHGDPSGHLRGRKLADYALWRQMRPVRREVSIRRFCNGTAQSGDFSPQPCGAGTYTGPASEAEVDAT